MLSQIKLALVQLFFFLAVLTSSSASQTEATQPAQPRPREWTKIEEVLGRAGDMQDGRVFKFTFPRSDMKVKVQDVEINPGLALGSWLAFRRHGRGSVVTGDLVLAENEVASVVRKLKEKGISIAALHNHLLYEQPAIMYLHVMGHGEANRLAMALREALELTKTPREAPSPSDQASDSGLDVAQLEQIIGQKARVSGRIVKFEVARRERIREHGVLLPPAMGMATVLNFQATGDGRAAISGDFVLRTTEVDGVIGKLVENGIDVTALHNHLLSSQPPLMFLHFWAHADALQLARGLRAALDQTSSRK
jgi:hypothetical protein